MYERFDRATKDLQEIVANAQKEIEEMVEALLEENEKKYDQLCDEVLEIEDDEAAGTKAEHKPVRCETRLANFEYVFCRWFFGKLFIVS